MNLKKGWWIGTVN